jgi:hypothetical protein
VTSAESYLTTIEAELLTTGGIVERSEIILDPLVPDDVGTLRMSLAYPTGHRVYLALAVDVNLGYPVWLTYAVHCMQPTGQTAFRYDNVGHHPELDTFPDHKHIGARERAVAHPRPTVAHLVREILDVVELL